MYVVNRTRGTYLGVNIKVANSFTSRLRGLYGHPDLPFGDGVWLVPCNSVQTIGLGRVIDLIFVDKAGRVVRIIEQVGPGRVIWPVRGAHSVLEVPAGVARSSETQVGDSFLFVNDVKEPAILQPSADAADG
ncbi:MAG: DUF192 domain-containing protein [Armatimonadota bacterium]|nr:DUF192 domain-containing protein [Armatimonadota bacterium]